MNLPSPNEISFNPHKGYQSEVVFALKPGISVRNIDKTLEQIKKNLVDQMEKFVPHGFRNRVQIKKIIQPAGQPSRMKWEYTAI